MNRPLLPLALLALLAGCADRSAPPRPIAPVAAYLSADDYPAAALRNEEQGNTQVRLTVGADGRVSACQVSGTSGSFVLDQATCRILRARLRFHPALDRKGRPAAGPFEARINWRLPPE